MVTLSASYSVSSTYRIRKAPPRLLLSSGGSASVFSVTHHQPLCTSMSVCVRGIATRVRRGLLLKFPTAYDIENVYSIGGAGRRSIDMIELSFRAIDLS